MMNTTRLDNLLIIIFGCFLLWADLGTAYCPKGCQCIPVQQNSREQVTCKWSSFKGKINLEPFSKPGQISALRIECQNLEEPSNFFNGIFKSFKNLKQLTLRNCVPGLGTFPKGLLEGLGKLQTLTLQGNLGINRIEIEPGFLEPSPNLESLEISNFGLARLPPKELCHLKELKLLNLSNNILPSLEASGAEKCPGQLVLLDLSRNQIGSIPPFWFRNFSQVIHLSLDQNWLQSVQLDSLTGLGNLQKLNLANNQIRDFQEDLNSAVPNLRTLDISRNELSTLPQSLVSGPSILSLNLSGNAISDLESELVILDMERLASLDLSHNSIGQLPSHFFDNLTSLQELHLGSNKLKVLPPFTFSDLANLEVLDLEKNELGALRHDSFYHLEKLSTLSLSSNALTALSDDFFAGMPRVANLDLSRNLLQHAPSALTVLYYLSELNLSHNRLNITHKFLFDRLTNLKILNLAHNFLTEVERYVFENVPKLELLDLSGNLISSLKPNCLHKSNNLQKLYLQDNLVDSIQGTLPNLPALTLVNITNNLVGHIDHSMLPPGLSVLLASGNRIEKFTNFLSREIRLEILDMAWNNLTILQAPALPDSLVMANFSHNQIAKFGENALLAKVNLSHFDLSHNLLEEVSESSVTSLQDRIVGPTLYLKGNPLSCSCKMDWLKTVEFAGKAGASNLPHVDNYESLRCTRVLSKGDPQGIAPPVLISQVAKSEFLCPYQELCYDHCVCCKFDACDCRSTCPSGCTCYQDSSFAENVIHCTGISRPDFSLIQIPMSATRIRLDGTKIGAQLKKHSFLGRYRLRELHLNGTGISAIEPRAFVGLTALKVLDLSGNNISEIAGDEFVNVPRLTSLNLAQNRIEKIGQTTFDGMPHLVHLNVKSNQLKFLPDSISGLSLIKPDLRLTIGENPWKCDCFDRFDLQVWLPKKFSQVTDYRSVYCFENFLDTNANTSTVLSTLPSIGNENSIKVNFWTFRKDFNGSTLCEGRPAPTTPKHRGRFELIGPPLTTPPLRTNGSDDDQTNQLPDFSGESLLQRRNVIIWALVIGLLCFVLLCFLFCLLFWRFKHKLKGASNKLNTSGGTASSQHNYSAGSTKQILMSTPRTQRVQLSDMGDSSTISPNSSGGLSCSPYRGPSAPLMEPDDAFVLYSLADRGFVEGQIVDPLENEVPYYQLQLLHRDVNSPVNVHVIDDSIISIANRCKRVILVISEAFLRGEWHLLHIKTAVETVKQKCPSKLIAIMLQENVTDSSSNIDEGLAKVLRQTRGWYASDPLFKSKLRESLPDKIVYSLNTTLQSSNGGTTSYDSYSPIVPSQFV